MPLMHSDRTSVPAPSTDDGRERFDLTVLLLVVFGYLLLHVLVTATHFVPFPESWRKSSLLGVIGFLVSLGPFTLLQVAMVRSLTAWRVGFRSRIGALLLAAAFWGFFLVLTGSARGFPGAALQALLSPWSNLALIATAVLAGSLVSLAIREAAVLLPVALISGMVDTWGVYFGTTHRVLEKAPEIVEKVSAHVPTVTFGGAPIVPTIGPGDFLFLGIFFSCLHRLGLDVARTSRLFIVLLLASLLVVAVSDIPIPGLAPMAIALLLVNAGRMRMSRSEIFATLYAVGFIAVLLTVLTIWSPF